MKMLFYLLFITLPLGAVDITITIGAQSEIFTVSSDDIIAVQVLRATRIDENGECPALKTDGVKHDCSTGIKYLMWKIKQLVNHAKEHFPQGLDATDHAAIKVLKDKIEDRKVE